MRRLRNETCYKCEDRVVGCHSTCERYLAERKKLDDVKKKNEGNRVTAQYLCDHHNIKMKIYFKKKRYSPTVRDMR